MARIGGINPAGQPSSGTPNGNGFGTGQAHGYARAQSSNALIDGLRSLGDGARQIGHRITVRVSNATSQLRGGHTSWQQPYPGAAGHSGNPADPPVGGPYTVRYDQTVQPQPASQDAFGQKSINMMSLGVALALGSVWLPLALFGFGFRRDAQKNAARFQQMYGAEAPQSGDNRRQNRAGPVAYAGPSYIPPMPWGAGMGPMWTTDAGWVPNTMYQSGMPYIPYMPPVMQPVWPATPPAASSPSASRHSSATSTASPPQPASARSTGTPRFAPGKGTDSSAGTTTPPANPAGSAEKPGLSGRPRPDHLPHVDSEHHEGDVVQAELVDDDDPGSHAAMEDPNVVDAEIVDEGTSSGPTTQSAKGKAQQNDWRTVLGLDANAKRVDVEMRYLEMLAQSAGSTHPDAPDPASIVAAREQAIAYFDSRDAA